LLRRLRIRAVLHHGDEDLMDHYEMLGIEKGATRKEIKKAYKAMASKSHPDKGGDPKTHQALTVAYNILSDPNRRDQYDRTGDANQAAPQARWEILIRSLFDILISQNFQGHIIKEARSRLIASSMAQQSQLSKDRQMLKAMTAKLGRIITRKDTPNFYEGLLLQKVDFIKGNIERGNEEIEAISDALNQLDAYTDTSPEAAPGPPGGLGAFFTNQPTYGSEK